MTKTEIFIYDNIQQIVVDAYLVEGIPLDVIAKANLEWTRIRQEYRNRCKQQGLPYPEHSHWDWEDKVKHSEMFSMIQTRFGIVCRDEVQGLMLVEQMTECSKFSMLQAIPPRPLRLCARNAQKSGVPFFAK